MKSFRHFHVRSLREAASLLAKYRGNARINAGGTDLLGCLRDYCLAEYPEAVIDIKGIPGLDHIKSGSRGLSIGALAKLADVVQSPVVREEYPLLAEAARSVATPNIRNMATAGGNLVQEIRCWYYRYPRHIGGPIVCLRKGGKACNAAAGDNRYHSVFGPAPAPPPEMSVTGANTGSGAAAVRPRGGCFAVNPSDLAVALLALNGIVVTTGRSIPAETFFMADTVRTTVLEPDEIIKEIRVPKPPKMNRQAYLKFTLRKPVDFAVVSTACVISEKGGICSGARLVLGAVGPSPLRARSAEEFMTGKPINEETASEAAQLAFAAARPLGMNGYKIRIGMTLIRRALLNIPE
ncbi:MAG TPA: FAD binding domain-containing protein [Acidobacteriota bacterium]|nr:FAD binding domain-containing protein [Acidobacteriota bacterium]